MFQQPAINNKILKMLKNCNPFSGRKQLYKYDYSRSITIVKT